MTTRYHLDVDLAQAITSLLQFGREKLSNSHAFLGGVDAS